MTGEIYFGTPGALIELPHPRGGIQTTRVRPSAAFNTASGGSRFSKTLQGKRRFTLNYEQLWYDTAQAIEAYDQGHNGPGPFVLHDPGRINWLTVNQSAATSHTNDTTDFTLEDTTATVLNDNFTRSSSGSWGTASTIGGTWSNVGGYPGAYFTSSNEGFQQNVATNSLLMNSMSVASTDVELDCATRMNYSSATGAAIHQYICVRFTDSSNFYYARLTLSAGTPVLNLYLYKRVAGVDILLDGPYQITSAHVSNQYFRVAVRAEGTTISAKSWQDGTTEPSSFQLTATDSSISGGTSIALGSIFDTGNTDGIKNTRFDNVVVDAILSSINSVPTPQAGLAVDGSANCNASTPDDAALDITGDIDLRADATLSNSEWFSVAGRALVAKYDATGNQRSYKLYIENGLLRLAWSNNGTTVLGISPDAAHVPASSGRLAVRATMDVDDGAGNRVIRFYTAPTLGGTWTQLGSTITTAGTTSIFNSTATVFVGADTGGSVLTGLVHAAEVRNGIDGTVVANPRFDQQPAGTTSFADTAGRTWTVNGTAAIVAGTSRGPRVLSWVYTGTASATPDVTLDSPASDWPGIPVIAGQAVVFSFQARGGGSDPVVTLTPRLRWLDANGAFISSTDGSIVVTSVNDWATASVTATPPTGAVYMLCQIECTSGHQNGSFVYLDSFQLERGSTPSSWRPGTGILPVGVVSLQEQWPWQAATFRDSPTLVLQELGR